MAHPSQDEILKRMIEIENRLKTERTGEQNGVPGRYVNGKFVPDIIIQPEPES